MRHALASVCAFASNVLLAVGFALALLSHFLECERSIRMSDQDRLQQSQEEEDREQRRIDKRNAWFVGLFVLAAIAIGVYLKFFYTPQPIELPPEPVTATSATSCAITVNGKSGTVTLRPGDNMTLKIRCAPDVQVVDLIASVPPPGGVVGAERMESTGNGVYGGDTFVIPEVAVDVTVTWWVWADGKPADSVTVRVVR